MVHCEGKIVLVNSAAMKFMGATDKSVFIGTPVIEYAHPDSRPMALERMQKLFREGGTTDIAEEKFIKLNGEIRDVEVIASIIHYKGKPSVQVFFNDITERKRSEHKLIESEERYRKVFNTIIDGLFISDTKGNIIDANNAACRIYGYSQDEFRKMNATQLIAPHYHSEFRNFIRQIIHHGIYSGETIDVRKDGSTFHTEVRGTTVSYQGKKHYLVIMRDVTEQRKAENALRENEYMLRRTQQIAKVGSYKTDLINRKTYWSEETINILGYNPADFNYDLQQIEELAIHPKDRDIFKNAYRREHTRDDDISLEYRVILPTKKIKYINTTARVTYNDKGNPVAVIGSVHDITERKIAEMALRESEEKFRTFMETATDMMNIVNKNLRIIYANAAFYKNMGYDEEELIGMHVADLLHPDSREKYYTPEKHTELINKGSVSYEVTWITRTGREIIGELRIVAIYDENRNFAGSRGIFHDITDRKKFEQELIRAKERAEESDRLKSAFLANMSHEIRTPLNGILGFSQMLKETGYSKKQKEEFVDIITKSGNQLLDIISDILDISTIEAGEVSIHKEKFNLNNLLDDIRKLFVSSVALEKNKKPEFKTSYDLPDKESLINSDPGKLQIILNNLVSNAFKFTKKGFIEMGYRVVSDRLEFYVKDTGIGIPPDKQKIIFERFRQADDSHTRRFGGTGLGLSIARGFVELLGGSLWLESEPGKGSAFYFTVPYTSESATVRKEKNGKKGNIDWSNLTILIAEDEEMNYRLLDTILHGYGAHIHWAKNGYEAVDIVSRNAVDIVLMDIKMPEMDGFTAIKKIRKIKPGIPVLAQTAIAMPDELRKLSKSGFSDYLIKPINRNDLLKKIEKFIT
ncbi:MAG: PAS domain S-box protein [Bacteroidetes bacterium]|nr:PAS domain S-box protein [Bacteroidota bacterium]